MTTAEAPATSDGHERASAGPAAARAPWRRLAGLGGGRRTAFAIALACVIGALYLGLGARDAGRLERANELGTQGRFGAALAEAKRVSRAPAKGRAQLVQAYALVELGDDRQASPAFARAAAADPSNWVIHRDWASTLLRLGQVAQARDEMGIALGLNPRMELPPGFTRSAIATK